MRLARETFYQGAQANEVIGNPNSCHYSTICLINHSCLNNVKFFFVGNVGFILAIKEIKEGEEILDCYYPYTEDLY